MSKRLISRIPLVLRSSTVLAAILLSLTHETFAVDLQMRIEDVKFENGAIVKFNGLGSEKSSNSSEMLKKMVAGQTEDGRYTVFADIDGITVYPSFENYDLYVRSSAGDSSALTRFTFQATPYDTFVDQSRSIRIHILSGAEDRTVELSVPLHSLKAGNALLTELSGTAKVHLSGDTVSIDLQNKYQLPVTITGASTGEVAKTHWTSQPLIASTVPVSLGSDENNSHTNLYWKVQPRAWGILRDSLIPFSPRGSPGSDADENLDFSIDYVTAEGGFPHTLKVHRSVYFYPSFPVLVGVASLGALAGGLVMFFGIRRDSGVLKFCKYLWPNIVLAVLIEVIAIVLFSFDNSKIQIGMVNLNPTLLIPAACLGAISVFYGFRLIEKWLGKAGANETPAAANGGD